MISNVSSLPNPDKPEPKRLSREKSFAGRVSVTRHNISRIVIVGCPSGYYADAPNPTYALPEPSRATES